MKHATKHRPRVDERTPIRARWTAQPPGNGDEAVAGALLRAASAAARPIGSVAEVGARWLGGAAPRSRPLAWQIVVVIVLISLSGVLSAAALGIWRGANETVRQQPEPSPVMPVPPKKHRVRAALVPTPAPASSEQPPLHPGSAMQAPAPSPHDGVTTPAIRKLALRALPRDDSQTSAPASVPAVAPIRAPDPAASAPIPPEPSALARESSLLASAISALRQDGKPEQALRILDQHRAELAASALAPEATITRIEALLRLGRNHEALALLDAQHLVAKGIGSDMLVARGELRADQGRCATALSDFEAVLSQSSANDSLAERALYGRAACRAKASDWQGARRDFEGYLLAYPRGRFAERARTALGIESR